MGYRIHQFNEWLAVRGVIVFGSMWACYLFFCYGFIPVMFPQYMNELLYWSNTVQLWSLPLLMVGQNVQGRASDKRAQEMYDMVKEELSDVKEELALAREERRDMAEELRMTREELRLIRLIAARVGVADEEAGLDD